MNIELNENFKGKCLVSMPSIGDDIFHQSVIYITEHSTISGAIGVNFNIILNNGEIFQPI
mgnify:CR=1 FL=1